MTSHIVACFWQLLFTNYSSFVPQSHFQVKPFRKSHRWFSHLKWCLFRGSYRVHVAIMGCTWLLRVYVANLKKEPKKSRDLWRYTSHFFHCSLSLFSRQGSNNIWCDFLETALPNQRKKTTELHWLHCKRYWAWDSRHANTYVGQRYLA